MQVEVKTENVVVTTTVQTKFVTLKMTERQALVLKALMGTLSSTRLADLVQNNIALDFSNNSVSSFSDDEINHIIFRALDKVV